MARKDQFIDGFDDATASYIVSVFLLALLPSAFAYDILAGFIMTIFAVGLGVMSFMDSVNDLRKKSFGWIAGFCSGMLIFDPEMLIAIFVVVLLIVLGTIYRKGCESY